MKKILLASIGIVALLMACNPAKRKPGEAEKESILKFRLSEQWRTDSVLMTPESVMYDSIRNVLYVSDMNQEPFTKDNNGFITRMNTDGTITDLKWVEGLSSPKGMAIAGDTLYAADVDEIVLISIKVGKIIRKVPVPGAVMLNDISADGRGNLYLTDTKANKIFLYSGGKLSEWLTEGLNGPNGVLVSGDSVLIGSEGDNNLSSVKIDTREQRILTDSIVHADGIAYTGIPGYYLVTDWNGVIYMVNPDNSKSLLLDTRSGRINSADIAYVIKDSLLVVPTFYRNFVVAYKVSRY
jgi:sugar lactone lactonase YvrE